MAERRPHRIHSVSEGKWRAAEAEPPRLKSSSAGAATQRSEMAIPRRVDRQECQTAEGAVPVHDQSQLGPAVTEDNQDMVLTVKIHTNELHNVWDKLFVHPVERNHILNQLRNQCIDLYVQRLDYENGRAFKLMSAIAKSEDEIKRLCEELDKPEIAVPKETLSLQAKLEFMTTVLENLRKEESKRWMEFVDVIEEIEDFPTAIRPAGFFPSMDLYSDAPDLSLRRLNELRKLLELFKKEEVCIVKLSLGHVKSIYSLCEVLEMDFVQVIFQNGSGCTLDDLEQTDKRLTEIKKERLQKLQSMQTEILDLWDLLEITISEQQNYREIMRTLNASLDDVQEFQSLSNDLLKRAEHELMRLEDLRMTKIKDISGKRTELEEVNKISENVKTWEKEQGTKFLYEEAEHELMRLEDLRMAKIKDISGERTELEEVNKMSENVKTWEREHGTKFLYEESNVSNALQGMAEEAQMVKRGANLSESCSDDSGDDSKDSNFHTSSSDSNYHTSSSDSNYHTSSSEDPTYQPSDGTDSESGGG